MSRAVIVCGQPKLCTIMALHKSTQGAKRALAHVAQLQTRCTAKCTAVRRRVRVQAENDVTDQIGNEIESDQAKKQREIEELRAQEKWMKVGSGEADCLNCGYHYTPKNGDPEYPVGPGTLYQDLPKDWQCPTCGAAKKTFQVQEKEVAGFAANQGYGLGTNSMTEGQKSGLIYGSLLAFFGLFLAGYFLQ